MRLREQSRREDRGRRVGRREKPAVRKTKTASKVKRPKSPAVQRPTRVGGNTDEILLAQSLKEELDIQSIVENELNSDNK